MHRDARTHRFVNPSAYFDTRASWRPDGPPGRKRDRCGNEAGRGCPDTRGRERDNARGVGMFGAWRARGDSHEHGDARRVWRVPTAGGIGRTCTAVEEETSTDVPPAPPENVVGDDREQEGLPWCVLQGPDRPDVERRGCLVGIAVDGIAHRRRGEERDGERRATKSAIVKALRPLMSQSCSAEKKPRCQRPCPIDAV